MKNLLLSILFLGMLSVSAFSQGTEGSDRTDYLTLPIPSGDVEYMPPIHFVNCPSAPVQLKTYGNSTYIGEIVSDKNPCPPSDFPCIPGIVLWLETNSCEFVLSINSHWITDNKIVVDGIEYFEGDEVQITGTVTVLQDMYSEEYFELEIETIISWVGGNFENPECPPLNIEQTDTSTTAGIKVYPNSANTMLHIVLAEFSNGSLVLYDLHGKAVLTQSINGTNAVMNIDSLASGNYILCLIQNGSKSKGVKVVKL